MAAGDIKIFTIVENGVSLEVTAVDMGDGTTSFSIKCLSGSADVNALYWHDDVDDGSSWSVYDDTGNKADKSLNMNGTGEDWDGGVKLSSPGLGTDGTNKSTYLTAGETLDSFTLNVSWDDLDTLGVRATSVGEDMTSIKGVADEPVEYTFPAITVEDVLVGEGDGTATVTISLSDGDYPYPITVYYSTSDGNAEDGSDYTGVSSSVTFLPGETTKDVDISITDDSDVEDDETFTFNLDSAVPDVPGDDPTIYPPDTATVTIQDNDEAGPPPNQPPTDIRLTIAESFAAIAAGVTAGGASATANNVIAATGANLLIGSLTAADPDGGDTHTFTIDSDPTNQFTIVGGNLYLLNGSQIDSADNGVTLTIKVTDGGGNVYYEKFTFLTGTSAANSISSGTVVGGTGSQLDPATGDDIIFGFGQNDSLSGNGGDDAVFGGQGSDNPVSGGTGNDQLFGGVNGDTLSGGSGNDTLVGNAGADSLSGGADNDTFKFVSADDSTNSVFDTITDWGTGDNTIDLSMIDANTGVALDQAFSFVVAETTGAVANSITWDKSGGQTIILGDTDGNAATVELKIVLTGEFDMTAADFIL